MLRRVNCASCLPSFMIHTSIFSRRSTSSIIYVRGVLKRPTAAKKERKSGRRPRRPPSTFTWPPSPHSSPSPPPASWNSSSSPGAPLIKFFANVNGFSGFGNLFVSGTVKSQKPAFLPAGSMEHPPRPPPAPAALQERPGVGRHSAVRAARVGRPLRPPRRPRARPDCGGGGGGRVSPAPPAGGVPRPRRASLPRPPTLRDSGRFAGPILRAVWPRTYDD